MNTIWLLMSYWNQDSHMNLLTLGHLFVRIYFIFPIQNVYVVNCISSRMASFFTIKVLLFIICILCLKF